MMGVCLCVNVCVCALKSRGLSSLDFFGAGTDIEASAESIRISTLPRRGTLLELFARLLVALLFQSGAMQFRQTCDKTCMKAKPNT